MPAPSGAESQVGWDFSDGVSSFGEAIRQGPVSNFFRFKTMTGLVAKRAFLRNENMDPSRQRRKGTAGPASIAPKFTMNPDVNSIVKLLVHHAGKDATITTPTGGTSSRQWVIQPFQTGDSAPASHIDTIFFEASDGDGYPVLVDGARMQDLGIKIDSGKLNVVEMGFLACTDTYVSDATQVTLGAGAYSEKPIVRGHLRDGLTALHVSITAVNGSSGGTAKWDDDGTFGGSTTIAFDYDKWYRIPMDDGTRAGISKKEDAWFCFPSPTSGVVTVGDKWSFASSRTVATASYSTLDPLDAASLEFTADGSTYYVKSADIKITRPRKAYMPAGTNYALTVQNAGEWNVQITIDRDREDRDFLKKLISGDSFAVVIKMYGNPIEGAIDELWQINTNVQVADSQRDVTSADTLPEKIVLEGHRDGSTDIFQHTVICTVTAL